MKEKDFSEQIHRNYSQMTAEEKQNSQKRIAKRLEQITDPENEQKLLKKRQVKLIFQKSVFSSPLKRLVLLKDYTYPTDAEIIPGIKEDFFNKGEENYTEADVSRELKKIKDRYLDIKDKITAFSDDIINNRCNYNYSIIGRPGAGKTYLAISLMGQLMLERKSVLFLNMSKLKDLAFDFKSEDSQNRIKAIKKYAYLCDLLILDDLGTESNNRTKITEASETIQKIIYDLVDARYGNYKPVLITTNMVTPPEFYTLYNEKIVSRILPDGEHVANLNQLVDLRGHN